MERNPFTLGDSSTPGKTEKLREFVGKLQEVSGLLLPVRQRELGGALTPGRSLQIIEGRRKVRFIMDDPAGNSYLQVRCGHAGVTSSVSPEPLGSVFSFVSLVRVVLSLAGRGDQHLPPGWGLRGVWADRSQLSVG